MEKWYSNFPCIHHTLLTMIIHDQSLPLYAIHSWSFSRTSQYCIVIDKYNDKAFWSICKTRLRLFPTSLVVCVWPSFSHVAIGVSWGSGAGASMVGDKEFWDYWLMCFSLVWTWSQMHNFHIIMDCYWACLTLWFSGPNGKQLMIGSSMYGYVVFHGQVLHVYKGSVASGSCV